MPDRDSFLYICKEYFANTVILPLFVMSFILLLKSWNKEKRCVSFLVIGISILFLYNGIVYSVSQLVGEENTYYRFFWICPMILVISVAIIKLFFEVKMSGRVMLAIMLLVMCFGFSSRPVSNWVDIPENVYQIDTDVIQVSDAVMQITGNKKTTLIDNGDIADTIRQYNAKIGFTELNVADLSYILGGYNTNYLGRFLMDFLRTNKSEFVVLKKEQLSVCSVIETAGLDCVAETDNYYIYKMDYDKVNEDRNCISAIEANLNIFTNMEYIPIEEAKKTFEFIYVSDFGAVDDTVYQNIVDEINTLQSGCLIVNNQYQGNTTWHLDNQEILEQLTVPYYCNNQAFQVIEEDGFYLCLIDNTIEVTETTIASLERLKEDRIPIILVLSVEISKEDKLYSVITEEDSPIVEVLSTRKDCYLKSMLGEEVLQYAIPVNVETMFNIVRVKAGENKG